MTISEFWNGKEPVTGKARECDKCGETVTEYIEENRYTVYCKNCAVEIFEDFLDSQNN